MTATDELRALLDERGVEWMDDSYAQLWCTVWHGQDGKQWRMTENRSGMLTELKAWQTTPAQAIAATLGRGTCKKVYLVETSDDLIESWYPIAVYLHRESAEDCAEALRKEEDGIRQFARVSELRVVDG